MSVDDLDDSGYMLDARDQSLLSLVAVVIDRAVLSANIMWAAKVSLSKLLHVLSRLPEQSTNPSLRVTVSTPRTQYGEEEVYFSLTVAVQDDVIEVQYGGYYWRPGTGGDSFNVFWWRAAEGQDAEFTSYAGSLEVVSRLVNPMEVLLAMPQTLHLCDIEVADEENLLLEDALHEPTFIEAALSRIDDQSPVEGDVSEDDETSCIDGDIDEGGESAAPLIVSPATEADHRLLAKFGPNALPSRSAGMAYGVEQCDGCGIDLSTVGLFVDGKSPRDGWGNYCSACCLAHGVSVGWGKGQLYAKQPRGSWLGIAGFDR